MTRNGNTGKFVPSLLAERPLTRAAFDLAVRAHSAQTRGVDQVPYVLHPLEAAALLHSLGFEDTVTAAAVLHDSLEDTDLEADQIEARIGPRVAALVEVLSSDEATGDEARRKAALREQIATAEPEAAAIYAADKVSKARELRARLSQDPELAGSNDAELKLGHYRASIAALEQALGSHPLVEQLRFEIEALDALPPHGRPIAAVH